MSYYRDSYRYREPLPTARIRMGHLCPCEHEDIQHSRHLGCFVIGCYCPDTSRSVAPERAR